MELGLIGCAESAQTIPLSFILQFLLKEWLVRAKVRSPWLGAKCKGKTLLIIESFSTFFNTALSQSSIVAQYQKRNMIYE